LEKRLPPFYADRDMRTADFDFDLPPELIAQVPAAKRDESRLLVLHRDSGTVEHRTFRDVLEFFRAGDVLVLNNSRVIPARLRGVNAKSGGRFEILLLEENSVNDWWAMLRPGKRARVGTRIQIISRSSRREEAPTDFRLPIADCGIEATVLETNDEGHRRLRFSGTKNILNELEMIGEIPLPPYIHRDGTPSTASARTENSQRAEATLGVPHAQDRERYQTVFAQPPGSVAAPTAGLHFTEQLLDEIRARGVKVCFVTLHVGLGTFAPVKTETLAAHKMHEERFELSDETAQIITAAKRENRRVFAVGTTTVRVLESAAQQHRSGMVPGPGRTNKRPGSVARPPVGGVRSSRTPRLPRSLAGLRVE